MSRRLPVLGGGWYWTDNDDEYFRAWTTIGERLAKLLGGKLGSYDPNFQIHYIQERNGKNIITHSDTIHLELAWKIINLGKHIP